MPLSTKNVILNILSLHNFEINSIAKSIAFHDILQEEYLGRYGDYFNEQRTDFVEKFKYVKKKLHIFQHFCVYICFIIHNKNFDSFIRGDCGQCF